MLPQFLLFLLIPLTILRIYSYCIDIANKKIKPNLSSWLIWTLANSVSIIGSLLKGVPALEVASTIAVTLSFVFIILLSIKTKQYFVDPTNTDKICFVLGLIGIFILVFVQEKNYAIGLSIIIDAIACYPTIYKIWTSKTKNENGINFFYAFLMAVLNLLTLSQFTFANSGMLFYKLFSTTSLFGSVFVKNKRL